MVIKQSNDQSGFISRSHRDYFSMQMFVSTSFNRGNYIQLGLWATLEFYFGSLYFYTLVRERYTMVHFENFMNSKELTDEHWWR